MACKSIWDVPMPGSPPTRITEPVTTPPPRTLSSSLIPVEVLCSYPAFIELRSCGSDLRNCTGRESREGTDSFLSSTRVFHSPQSGHLPSHLVLVYPHD